MAGRMRSKLFVPAARPELFAKALAGEADALSFDLEDSVPEGGKAAARAALAEVLASDAVRGSAKTIVVRVNGPASPHFVADAAALAGGRVDLVNLPKIETPCDVRGAAATIEAPLLVTIESARGLNEAAAIARAHPRVAGLQVGLNDLFAELGADRHAPANVHAALWQVRVAAGTVFACDGAWPDLADEAGFREEAALARSLGYVGKSCVHPRQVPIANAVFAVADDALAAARRLLAAAAAAEAEGRGAFRLDGRMVDRPMIEAARALLAGAA